jgi:hypothetical protein
VRDNIPHASKNGNLSHSHAGLHACTDEKPEKDVTGEFDQKTDDLWRDLDIPPSLDRRPKPERLGSPALGPAGDDLADFQ